LSNPFHRSSNAFTLCVCGSPPFSSSSLYPLVGFSLSPTMGRSALSSFLDFFCSVLLRGCLFCAPRTHQRSNSTSPFQAHSPIASRVTAFFLARVTFFCRHPQSSVFRNLDQARWSIGQRVNGNISDATYLPPRPFLPVARSLVLV